MEALILFHLFGGNILRFSELECAMRAIFVRWNLTAWFGASCTIRCRRPARQLGTPLGRRAWIEVTPRVFEADLHVASPLRAHEELSREAVTGPLALKA